MISIGDTIISDDLLAEEFVCNISKCKGECCVSGEAGAPLEKNEIKYLKKNFKISSCTTDYKCSEKKVLVCKNDMLDQLLFVTEEGLLYRIGAF